MLKSNTIIFLVLILFSCKGNQQEPDGGPCSYTEEALPATVVEIQPVNDAATAFDVLFAVTNGNGPDTIYYSSEGFGYLTKAEVDSLQLHPGRQFSYIHRTITSGSCSPDIYQLKMEPYQPGY